MGANPVETAEADGGPFGDPREGREVKSCAALGFLRGDLRAGSTLSHR